MAERRRLARLQRLERVRDIAKQALLAESAQAEQTLGQLESLAGKSRALASEYVAHDATLDGLALIQMLRFGEGLRGVSRRADDDAERARTIADRKSRELAEAERRRAAVESRVNAAVRGLARDAASVGATLTAPSRNWHDS